MRIETDHREFEWDLQTRCGRHAFEHPSTRLRSKTIWLVTTGERLICVQAIYTV